MRHSGREATVRVGVEKSYTQPQASRSRGEEFLKGIQLAFFLDVFQPSADFCHQFRIGANGQRLFPTVELIRAQMIATGFLWRVMVISSSSEDTSSTS